jgi:hypothetical protein
MFHQISERLSFDDPRLILIFNDFKLIKLERCRNRLEKDNRALKIKNLKVIF